VRLNSYICTICGHEFLSNDELVLTLNRSMDLPDNAGVKDRCCEDFAVYWQRIVRLPQLPSQYRTSLAGQDMRMSVPYSEDQ